MISVRGRRLGTLWTLHALEKAQQLGLARKDAEAALLEGHRRRERNKGRASWRVVAGRFVLAYEHPDGDDSLVARIVTVATALAPPTSAQPPTPPDPRRPQAPKPSRYGQSPRTIHQRGGFRLKLAPEQSR